jgi:hypothetical protein
MRCSPHGGPLESVCSGADLSPHGPTPVGKGSFANSLATFPEKASAVQAFQLRNILFLHSAEISAEPKIQFTAAEELRDAVSQFLYVFRTVISVASGEFACIIWAV